MESEQPAQKPSRHICLTNRNALGISDDPEFDMLSALADKDVLTLVRGLSREEARSPFPDGLFGLDGPRTNAAIRSLLPERLQVQGPGPLPRGAHQGLNHLNSR